MSASNLLVAPGDASADDLLKAAGDGLYVMGVAGLHSGVNPVSGSFSVGATGRLIRDGRAGRAGARDDHRLGPRLDAAGRRRAPRGEARWVPFGGSVQAPALLVREMTVAGS